MGSAPRPRDADVRARALDTGRSFIVQAPAGSGKTELLVQRFLGLLARVEEPEQILALTFTRKAAGEMRGRILAALEAARGPAPQEEHARRTWELAREAQDRDRARDWDVSGSPARLKVSTIDSLCAELVRRMPWLSRLGGTPDVAEDPRALYREAAERSLEWLETDARWAEPMAVLLERLDNDRGRAVREIATLLERRDQWLRHLGAEEVHREAIEAGVRESVKERLTELRARLSGRRGDELVALAGFAAENLARAGKDEPVVLHGPWRELPGTGPDARSAWSALAWLLLSKQKGEPRKRFDKSVGFPSPNEKHLGPEEEQRRLEMKQRAEALAADLREDVALAARLHEVRVLPDPALAEADWAALEALAQALLAAAAQLRLVFRERRCTDYIEVARGAIEALGEPEAPTDLTLALDARIHHLLVDEFQDTSATQVELLERLTAGWEPEDGRTLFAVGDPMQSIYAFREADVGLFLRSRRAGPGGLWLEPLELETNFRSTPELVSWVNDAFAPAFPREERIDEGGVCFAASTPFVPPRPRSRVAVHPLIDASPARQAERVADVVEEELRGDPERRVAVLVRARSHLAELVPVLRRRGVRFQGVEIERLGERPVVQDLLALTRALAHPADRVAWLAVLRAPWCGLGIPDLHALVDGADEGCLWTLLHDEPRLARSSEDGRRRALAFRERLAPVLAEVGRRPLRELVRLAWLRLDGPSAAAEDRDLEDAEIFLERLGRYERSAPALDVTALERELEDLYAAPDAAAPDRLQVLTIHRAKGLEFDSVVLPFLERRTASTGKRLVEWIERAGLERGTSLMVAPMRAASEAESAPIRTFVESVQKRREENEQVRLGYVAATRARHRLHLLGSARLKEGQVAAPDRGSLLRVLWPALEPTFHDAALAVQSAASAPEDHPASTERPGLRRLRVGDASASPPEDVPVRLAEPERVETEEEVPYEWARPVRRHVGTVVHRVLEQIAREGLAGWPPQRVRDRAGVHRAALAGLGVSPGELDEATAQVGRALERVLASERGRSLLDDRQAGACSELKLASVENGTVRHLAIDRTFVDADGVRWVVDFKAGTHEGGDPEAFLEREAERYRPQLARYAEAMRRREEKREVRAALYFPLLDAWYPVDV
jgi:ATP-dependent exoDNAse (exonuclease V) beta subunit